MPEEEEQLEGPRNLEADDGGVDGAIFYYERQNNRESFSLLERKI
tara:strand:+ start:2519 stop:2653 length:135 start_codon:yes stop_codon:yes gene_type:complete